MKTTIIALRQSPCHCIITTGGISLKFSGNVLIIVFCKRSVTIFFYFTSCSRFISLNRGGLGLCQGVCTFFVKHLDLDSTACITVLYPLQSCSRPPLNVWGVQAPITNVFVTCLLKNHQVSGLSS